MRFKKLNKLEVLSVHQLQRGYTRLLGQDSEHNFLIKNQGQRGKETRTHEGN